MLGLQYTQPGGIRALTGKWDLIGPSQKDEASDTVKGSGGKAKSEVKPGNTFTYGDSEHTISSVDDDNTFTLTSPWGGPTGKGVEVYISGLKPESEMTPAEAKAAGVQLPGVASTLRPFYKSPIFIILMIGAGLALTYYLVRRKKGRK